MCGMSGPSGAEGRSALYTTLRAGAILLACDQTNIHQGRFETFVNLPFTYWPTMNLDILSTGVFVFKHILQIVTTRGTRYCSVCAHYTLLIQYN